MPTINGPAIYNELLDVLIERADLDRLSRFCLSEQMQARLDEILEKNREGTLADAESAELDDFERFEHVVRLVKGHLMQRVVK